MTLPELAHAPPTEILYPGPAATALSLPLGRTFTQATRETCLAYYVIQKLSGELWALHVYHLRPTPASPSPVLESQLPNATHGLSVNALRGFTRNEDGEALLGEIDQSMSTRLYSQFVCDDAGAFEVAQALMLQTLTGELPLGPKRQGAVSARWAQIFLQLATAANHRAFPRRPL